MLCLADGEMSLVDGVVKRSISHTSARRASSVKVVFLVAEFAISRFEDMFNATTAPVLQSSARNP